MKKFKWMMLLAFNTAMGQSEVKDITIKHQVKSGETLHSITRQYLGTDFLWQENWKLNPQIDNPNLLTIGEELTIIKERIIPAEKARIIDTVNRVEKKPVTSGWKITQPGDELVQQEGVRTYEQSTALLSFNDESTLKVLEFSQVFLKNRSTTLRGTDSATIEVIKGDTELNWEPLAKQPTDITIMLGSTMSKPQLSQGKATELRTGLTADGDSVISVYQGQSAVESAGNQVQVEQGMGVAVKQGEVPPPPQRLLPAPVMNPDNAGSYTYTNPVLSWEPVSGAHDYVIELCADAQCQVVIDETRQTENSWQDKQPRTAVDHYFRVAARSAEKLVGYRSEPQMLRFSTDQMDHSPPLVAIQLLGHKIIGDQQIIIGPQATWQIHVMDEQSGISTIEHRWNDQAWKPWSGEPVSMNDLNGTYWIRVSDQLNNEAIKSYHFVRLSESPDHQR
ncbi:hypothetical protein ACFODZ_03620 [Marinicella sediminis]|uniref:LysM domain-containing protein n=1 Tax=Marinicella sediminis TaxID=1792834 RepID=A0ABV7J8A9_9GAMM|nr:LysM domain-containing protein [Marinicella sediminis]